jgi:hypothetical protein
MQEGGVRSGPKPVFFGGPFGRGRISIRSGPVLPQARPAHPVEDEQISNVRILYKGEGYKGEGTREDAAREPPENETSCPEPRLFASRRRRRHRAPRERYPSLEGAEDAKPALAVAPSGAGEGVERLALDADQDDLDARFVEARHQ